MEENWDYLIILDACRYDYFLSMYENYFSGKLCKGISLGSYTPDWCMKSFTKYYPDVIYISGNPHINSKIELAGFDAKKHFYKIVDVWEFGWSEELGVVPPEKISEIVLSLVPKFHEKRFIIHYLQPHEPYITNEFQGKGFPKPDPRHERLLCGLQGNLVDRNFERLLALLNTLLMRTTLIKNPYKIRETLNLPPSCPLDAIRRKYGIGGLREAYKENLRTVLKNVAELCNELLFQDPSRSIAITSDHGELLGENGAFGHWVAQTNPIMRRNSILVEVPWFRVKTVKGTYHGSIDRSSQPVNKLAKLMVLNEKAKLKDRIEKLKSSGRV